MLNTVAVTVWTRDELSRPLLGAGVVLGVVVWSGFVVWACSDASRRTLRLLGLDLLVGVAALLATPWAKVEGFEATLAGFWVMSPMLAVAARFGWRGGLVAGLVVGGTDLAIRDGVTQSTYGNIFLLVVGGPVVGYLAESLQRSAVERDRAEREAAAAAERARLARAVHDGVLQVLALVQRRGRELGGEAAELGRVAGEQEEALRSLIRAQDRVAGDAGSGVVDLAAALAAVEAPGVVVSLPGGPVPLPAPVVHDLVAAVGACLDNVRVHAPGAGAWVLLESSGSGAEVTVRDDGPGIPAGRLEAAVAEGRLGVTGSIEGRLRDLGGSATVDSGTWGTEWRLSVPRVGVGA